MGKIDPATTWLPNLRWTLRDVDDIADMLRDGWDVASIAEAFLVSEAEISAFLERNGLRSLLQGIRT